MAADENIGNASLDMLKTNVHDRSSQTRPRCALHRDAELATLSDPAERGEHAGAARIVAERR